MDYITIKRYKRNDASGQFNIPYGSVLKEFNGQLFYNNKRVCSDHSAVMREYFARNDDGNGLKRGKLTQSIVNKLKIRLGETQEEYDKRWEPVWNDPVCEKYHKDHCENMFLWSIEFYNAPLLDLYHIAALVGAKV